MEKKRLVFGRSGEILTEKLIRRFDGGNPLAKRYSWVQQDERILAENVENLYFSEQTRGRDRGLSTDSPCTSR